jgi:hypothetical protein
MAAGSESNANAGSLTVKSIGIFIVQISLQAFITRLILTFVGRMFQALLGTRTCAQRRVGRRKRDADRHADDYADYASAYRRFK